MIIWINGAYGAGKSTVAEHLQRILPGTLLLDAEAVGNAVRDNLRPVNYHVEFPDYPIWRAFVARLAVEMAEHGRLVLIPMTMLCADALEEIFQVFVRHGVPYRHVILDLDPERIETRILQRGEGPGCWCMAQKERCPAMLAPLAGIHIDASPSVEQVVNAVRERCGI